MNARRLTLLVGCLLACLGAARDPVEELRHWVATPTDQRPDIRSLPFAAVPLSREQSAEARRILWDDHVASVRATRAREWADHSITLGDKNLKWKDKHFGTKPKDGWNLYLSLHGGGGAPARVNDQQWENQIKLYQPPDSLYIAPRAPTDNWNLWHEPHIDALFDRLIEDAVALGEVNPNRVYVMGYSAGGDGGVPARAADGRPLRRRRDDGRPSERGVAAGPAQHRLHHPRRRQRQRIQAERGRGPMEAET